MKEFLKSFFKYISGLVSLVLPSIASAQNTTVQQGLSPLGSLFPGISGSIAGATTLTGPYGLLYNIILTLLTLAGVVAIIFIIIGGFWYITSAGNEEQAEKGKSTLLNAIIGIVVIVLSYVIITVVSNFVVTGV